MSVILGKKKKPNRKHTEAEESKGTCGKAAGKTLTEKAIFPKF